MNRINYRNNTNHDTIRKFQENKYNKQSAGLVINSTAHKTIMDANNNNDQDLQSLFLELAKLCKSVVGVRLQPIKKRKLLNLYKNGSHRH